MAAVALAKDEEVVVKISRHIASLIGQLREELLKREVQLRGRGNGIVDLLALLVVGETNTGGLIDDEKVVVISPGLLSGFLELGGGVVEVWTELQVVTNHGRTTGSY